MKLQYTPKAREDLRRIQESILDKFDSPDLASQVLKQIMQSIRDLLIFPYKGNAVEKITGLKTEYRMIFCRKNHIFYRVEQDKVLIIRVLNEKQDYIRILFGISEDTEE